MEKFRNALAVVGAIIGIILLFVLEFYLDGIRGIVALGTIEILIVPILLMFKKEIAMFRTLEGILLSVAGAILIFITWPIEPFSLSVKSLVFFLGIAVFMIGTLLDPIINFFKKTQTEETISGKDGKTRFWVSVFITAIIILVVLIALIAIIFFLGMVMGMIP